jgi:serine/threonine protein kinase
MSSEYVATVTNGHTMTISRRYDFEKSKRLGRGGFSAVVSAVDTVKQTEVAIKRVRPYTANEYEIARVYRELMILKYLRAHPNVSYLIPSTINSLTNYNFESKVSKVIRFIGFRRKARVVFYHGVDGV